MTERGLPIVDGAPACPFVAFEDDRDERASSPDHRHRCYAEVRPAPRALAHQEAYCLSSAFPVCPTFQDWARREAARARREESGRLEDEDQGARRNPPRDWAAPPPWLGGDAGGGSGRRYQPGPDDADEEAEVAPLPPRGAGLSGGFAERLLGREGLAPDDDEAAAAPADALLPSVPRRPVTPTAPASAPAADRGETRRGYGGDDGSHDLDQDTDYDDDYEDDEEDEEDEEERAAAAAAAAARRRSRARDRDLGRDAEREDARRPLVSEARGRGELDAPSWERPRRLEAYPTLRKRGVSGIAIPSSLLLAVLAIAIAAVALFFLPQLFLGNPGAANATPTPTAGTASSAPSAAPPTATPAPSSQTYVVQAGDTMSKIAKKFGVPLQVLIDANKGTIPNPDALQIGQQVIIPSASATAAPAAVTAAPQ